MTRTPTETPTPTATVVGSNDEIGGATLVTSFPYATTQDTTKSTSASDDPDMGAGAAVNSNTVWFKLVPSTTAGMTVSTAGSSYDTVLAAFTGSKGGLVLVTSNDDANPSTLQSEISFNVQAGTTYFVEVAQYDTPGAGGSLRLFASLGATIVATSTSVPTPTLTPWPTVTPWPTWTPWPTSTATPTVVAGPVPANDNIGSATIVNRLPFSTIQDTTGATSASDDPDMGSNTGVNSNSVWFRLVANTAGRIRATTSGSSYDTVLAVYSGSTGALGLVGSNDDVANNGSTYNATSEVVFNALSGSTYFIEVAQYGEPGGGQLHISLDGAAGIAASPVAASTVTTPRIAGFMPEIPPAMPRSAMRDNRYFSLTGYRIDEDAFWDFFQKRGGVRTFGYPVSWEFRLLGFKVQFFQRGILQLMPNGSVAAMNLLDEGLMPYTRVNSSVFPAPDKVLMNAAPSPSQVDYGTRAVAFIEENVPNEWNGLPVDFLKSYMSAVRYEDAFPDGNGNEGLLPLLNLEMFGLPTSKPAYDPENHNFVYQRFQRGIFHYDATTGATQGLLLADYLKSIMTGENLPADLASQAMDSRFYLQWDRSQTGEVARPAELPGTNLAGAFEMSAP